MREEGYRPAASRQNGQFDTSTIKTFGYLISTISVVLLAVVSWPKAKDSPLLLACLIGGAITSIVGMFCRWLSYEIEKRRKDG